MNIEVPEQSPGSPSVVDGISRPSALRFQTSKWILLLAAVAVLFSWRIFFTSQFTISEDWEAANQNYAYAQFMVSSIQKGMAPFWNPYTYSGRTFIGDMQPGVFYPLKLILDLWPLGKGGILSNRLYMQYHVLVRFLAALFMFLLAGELGLKTRIAAFVSAICFGLGGMVGNLGGLVLLDSTVWLPLVLLFLLRAMRSSDTRRGILYAMLGGLCLAMPVLGGGLHIPLMDVLVILSIAAFLNFQTADWTGGRNGRSRLFWIVGVVVVIGTMSFIGSAVQLFPSMEFAPLSIHWSAQSPTLEKTRYAVMTYASAPRSLFAFFFGATPGASEFSPYIGVATIFLALAGGWVYRARPWVKYLAALAVLTYFYSLGAFSFLHGLGYLLVPYLDKAPEADRFLYLTHFALALLAGFGVDAFFTPGSDLEGFLPRFVRALGWVLIGFFAILGISTIYGKPDVSEWYFVSLLFFIATWGVFFYLVRGNRNRTAEFLLVAVILCDLYAFHWGDLNRMQRQKEGNDYLEQLLSGEHMANFFKAQPGLFRVHVDANVPDFINIGEMFGVQTTTGWSGATLIDYMPFLWNPKTLDLLNVRYVAVKGSELPGQPVFVEGAWKVYQHPTALPRAWMARRILHESSLETIKARLQAVDFDLVHEAFVEPKAEVPAFNDVSADDSIRFNDYQNNQFDLTVNAGASGLLVLSEIYYPGWEATVNGKAAKIYKVDGLLRGVVVSQGQNRVVMRYRPKSILVGGILTMLGFAGTFFFGVTVWLREKRRSPAARPK